MSVEEQIGFGQQVRKIKQERRIYRGCRKLQKGSTENFRSEPLLSQFCLGFKPTATVFRVQSVLSNEFLAAQWGLSWFKLNDTF